MPSSELELDTQYLSINIKEVKSKNMPRYSKKIGNQSTYRDVSHHKISIICIVDGRDHRTMNVAGLVNESFGKYRVNGKCFNDVKEVVSDFKRSIQ